MDRTTTQIKAARVECFFPEKQRQTRPDASGSTNALVASDVSFAFWMHVSAFAHPDAFKRVTGRDKTRFVDASTCIRCFILSASGRVRLFAFQPRLRCVYKRVYDQNIFTWAVERP